MDTNRLSKRAIFSLWIFTIFLPPPFWPEPYRLYINILFFFLLRQGEGKGEGKGSESKREKESEKSRNTKGNRECGSQNSLWSSWFLLAMGFTVGLCGGKEAEKGTIEKVCTLIMYPKLCLNLKDVLESRFT